MTKFKAGDIIITNGIEKLIRGIGRNLHSVECYGLSAPDDTKSFVKSRYDNIFAGFNEDIRCAELDKEAKFVCTIFERDAYCYIREELKSRKKEMVDIEKSIESLEYQLKAIESINNMGNLKVVVDAAEGDKKNQFENVGSDDDGNKIGNCTFCGRNGVRVKLHKCEN